MTRTSAQIRSEFIDFFRGKQHTFVPSAPVVPQDDPTLLFTNAGMNQFKAIFLGESDGALKRAANSQKCMRVSGKHNDLEEVGRDHTHHTFFEMLGNWSFGDYYKKEAITWAWELLTDVWKLDKKRLFVTVHTSDDEARRFWESQTDIEPWRILSFGDKDNFWEMGETGPCGPCSEIHYDKGDPSTQKATFSDQDEGVNGDNPRYVEIWNLVFMQNNRDKGGKLTPLPATHVDTGMGFERVVAILQDVDSNYATDLFAPLIARLEEMSGKRYRAGAAGTPFRVIADHIRALTFAISDGAFPSNEGRGYVLRRLLRRAFRFGRELELTEPFLYKIVPVLADSMGDAFVEVRQRRSHCMDVIRAEEERFGQTLEQGIQRFGQIVAECRESGRGTISGEEVFVLYDTFGFPVDLTRLMAAEKKLDIDEPGYEDRMAQQRERARNAAQKADDGGLSAEGWIELRPGGPTEFTGYDREEDSIAVCRYKEVPAKGLEKVYLAVFASTPFYAESGGQAGDTGILRTPAGRDLNVTDTFKWNDMMVHRISADAPVTPEEFAGPLQAVVNHGDRNATRKNHSATHLLQAALRAVAGEHVQQSGSRVDPVSLRFDFTHHKALLPDEIRDIEQRVNAWVLENHAVTTRIMAVDEAKKAGAIALFGEKYGETVRVVSMGSVSRELCGGTHVSATGEIGLFHITGESSISAGIRRIEAVTGMNSLACLNRAASIVGSLGRMLKVPEENILQRVGALIDSVKELEARITELSRRQASDTVSAILEEANRNRGAFAWLAKDLGPCDKKQFGAVSNAISDGIRDCDTVVVLGAAVGDRVMFSAGAGKSVPDRFGVHCGTLVRTAAQITGGNGGGSPVRAQAGGKNPAALSDALRAVEKLLREKAAA